MVLPRGRNPVGWVSAQKYPPRQESAPTSTGFVALSFTTDAAAPPSPEPHARIGELRVPPSGVFSCPG